MIKTFWAVKRNEMRLVWRRRAFWLVQGLIFLNAVTATLSTHSERLLWDFVTVEVRSLVSLELILLPILVGPAISRDLRDVGEMLWTTPLDALVHSAGVTAGLWLMLLPALIVQLGARWLGGYWIYREQIWLIWFYGLPWVIFSVSIGLGLAVLLVFLLRRTVPLLLLWGAGAGLAVFSVKMDSPFALGFSPLQISPTLGIGLYRPLLYGLGVWLAGVGLMTVPLAVGSALLADRRRGTRFIRALGLTVLIAGVVMGSGYFFHRRAEVAQATPISPLDVQLDVWTVQSHTMRVTVDAAQDLIDGDSTLVLVASADLEEVVLRLNPGFALREIQDGREQALAATRVGDSVVVALGTPTNTITLHLQWRGTPRPAYVDYGRFRQSTKRPVRALLSAGVGYLLRDGDWYPWPWTTSLDRWGEVTLHVTSERALTYPSLRDDVAHWEGVLPPVMLALPPAKAQLVDGITLYWGDLSSRRLKRRLDSYATLAGNLQVALGEDPSLAHVVASPYLAKVVWSRDLLLAPEGTGYLDWDRVGLAYAWSGKPGVEMRARTMILARAWLSSHLSVPTTFYRFHTNGALTKPGDTQACWVEAGYSVRYPDPDRQLTAVALWMALETTSDAVRQADLKLLRVAAAHHSPEAQLPQGFDWDVQRRLLPIGMIADREQSVLVLALHQWATKVGPERALRLAGDVVRAGGVFELKRLLGELAQVSDVVIEIEPDR